MIFMFRWFSSIDCSFLFIGIGGYRTAIPYIRAFSGKAELASLSSILQEAGFYDINCQDYRHHFV
jgi:hypothetical protein